MLTPKYKTQAQVNEAMKGLMEHALRAEERRDRERFESPEYWKHHDVAQGWYRKAEALMPHAQHSSFILDGARNVLSLTDAQVQVRARRAWDSNQGDDLRKLRAEGKRRGIRVA